MSNPRPALWSAFLAACLLWHALAIGSAWREVTRDASGRDFASYHYAVQVAVDGGDPYDKAQLGEAARVDGTRKGVHPFFYPPPYLLTMLWVRPLSLVAAYRTWFWLDELFALASVLALARWWRPLGDAVPYALAGVVALLTAWPNNHAMGQMNWPVVLLVVAGLWAADRGRDVAGGALVGLACMMKMSPALFVAWWLLHRRWRPAAAAVGAALALTVASLAVVGAGTQIRFYTDVLPAFASGRYNGLGVGIDLFGNHSVPNLLDAAFPGGRGHLVLSGTARALASVSSLVLVGGTAWTLRKAPADVRGVSAHVAAVATCMLLVPVITYEHHLVWAVPALVVAVDALCRGTLPPALRVPVALAVAVVPYDLDVLKQLSLSLAGPAPVASWVLQELKFAAVVVLWGMSLWLASRASSEVGSLRSAR